MRESAVHMRPPLIRVAPASSARGHFHDSEPPLLLAPASLLRGEKPPPLAPSVASRHDLVLLRRHALVPRRGAAGEAVVDAQAAAIGLLLGQHAQGLHGALDVNEVGVGEAPRLAGAAIDCDAHVDHIPDAAEQVVQVAICHLERHVADEEGLGGRILGSLGSLSSRAARAARVHFFAGVCGVLYDEATAFEELLVQGGNGVGRGIDLFEVDIPKAVCSVSRGLLHAG